MARLTLSEFLNNRNLLAIKISSHDLSGFFRKSITIPLNTTGLALFHDGTELAQHFEVVVDWPVTDLAAAKVRNESLTDRVD